MESSEDSESDSSQMSSSASSSSCESIECQERHQTKENVECLNSNIQDRENPINCNGNINGTDINYESSMDYQIQNLPNNLNGINSDNSKSDDE